MTEANKAYTNKCLTVNRLPKGFPRFVTQQTRVHNGSIQRRFERPGELLLCYTHYEVIFAEQRIYEYFLEHPDVCKRLTAGQRREPGKRCELEEIDALYEALERAYLRHRWSSFVLFPMGIKRTLVTLDVILTTWCCRYALNSPEREAIPPRRAPRRSSRSLLLSGQPGYH